MFIVHTLDEIQGLIDAHSQFKATLGEADKEFQSIMTLIKEVDSVAKQFNVPGATINPYTNLTGNVSLYPRLVAVCSSSLIISLISFSPGHQLEMERSEDPGATARPNPARRTEEAAEQRGSEEAVR